MPLLIVCDSFAVCLHRICLPGNTAVFFSKYTLVTESSFPQHFFLFLLSKTELKSPMEIKRNHHQRGLIVKWVYMMQHAIPGRSSLIPVVSEKRATLMPLCPLISIMHHLTVVGFLFTATSLCAFGIRSKCCDPSRQPVEQTADAHRAEQAVSSKSQLIFSCTSLTPGLFVWPVYLHRPISQK